MDYYKKYQKYKFKYLNLLNQSGGNYTDALKNVKKKWIIFRKCIYTK
jgi:hypothetical protein